MATTRLGFACTMLSVGMGEFFTLLYEDIELVLEVMNRYTQWLARAMDIVSDLGFDFVSASDDLAMKIDIQFHLDSKEALVKSLAD